MKNHFKYHQNECLNRGGAADAGEVGLKTADLAMKY